MYLSGDTTDREEAYPCFCCCCFYQYKATLGLNPYKPLLGLSVKKLDHKALTTFGTVQRNGKCSVKCVGGSCGTVVRKFQSGHQVSGH